MTTNFSGKKIRFLVLGALLGLVLWSVDVFFARMDSGPPEAEPLHLVNLKQPYLYAPNPGHPEISSQGLRDREYAIPKPAGVFRILMVGDSVTYGLFVRQDQVFAKVVERKLRSQNIEAEVLNAGVNGYTPYNELHYYERELVRFAPDLVMVCFCMNDISDPALHWNSGKGAISEIPPEAFPDPEYHKTAGETILLRQKKPVRRALARSGFFRFWMKAVDLHGRNHERVQRVDGKEWPVYIADEPSPTIRVLTDENSVHWEWLRAVYDRFRRSVERQGAHFSIVVFPLGYQLDPAYPYRPQEVFQKYCRENSIPCLDLLPGFQSRGPGGIFMGAHFHHFRDVWHLTPHGHEVTADLIIAFLRENGFIPGV